MQHWYLMNFALGALVATAALKVTFDVLDRLHPAGQPVTLGDLICRAVVGDR